MVQLLVAYGADVNDAHSEDSKTPLKKAIEDEHTDIADYLRSAGGVEKSFPGAASDGDINLVQSWLLISPKADNHHRK
jgi:ankyrin repeat protein